MAECAKVLVNPYAGRWKARDQIPQVRAALDRAGLQYDLEVTSAPGDGTALAQRAVENGYSPIIAVGGDGSYSEVANGLLAASGEGPTIPFGIIPLGTANDLAFGLGIPTAVEQAVGVIAAGHTRLIDVGLVNGRYFANNSAVGLEPVVTLENARLVRLKGIVRYLVAAVISIMRRPTWRMSMEWEGGSYQGSIVLVSVGNTTRTGGLFFMTPQAQVADGLLDFIFAPAMSRLTLMRLLPMTFSGKHVDRPEVSYARSRWLRITSEPGTPIQADGEVFELAADRVEYEVLPGKLTFLVPSSPKL